MKKLTMICMSALLMLAVSCKKDKKDEIENAGSGFRATVESHAGTGKTHLEGLAVKWDSDDAILVKSSTCSTPKRFTTTGTDASASFDAAEDLPENFYTPDYTGYYPGFETNPAGVYFSDDQLTLPATQQYVENTFANGANPMAATSSETLLPFKNICGVLKLQLYSETACNVDNITITSNEGEQLWGTGTVTLSGGIPSLGTLTGGGSTLTLDMGSTGKPMSTIESQPTTYYFVVPVGTLRTSFTVKVTDSNGKVWTKTANAPQNLIARSQITAMPKLSVATHTPVTPSEVTFTAGCSDEFTYNVGGSVTVPSGTYTCEFGYVYSATNAQPTLADTKVVAGIATFSGTKAFTVDITGLTVGTTYHVRAYAMIDGVTYSTVTDIVGGDVPLPLPSTWTNGKSPKKFSVSATKKVYFSQGNLQYRAKGGSAGNATATATPGNNVGGTWRFAEHQFDIINSANANAAQTYDGWIDLFGWGSTGYAPTGDSYYVNYQPWATSTSVVNETYNKYGYGPSTNSSNPNLSVSNGSDWGANAISNGGNTPNKWRTLIGGEGGEWDYLILSRPNAANLCGHGKVGNCTTGLIILPDDWTLPSGLSFTPGCANAFETNVYTYSEWAQMEAAGAVFFPAAGRRNGISFENVGIAGGYWSSLYNNSNNAYNLRFSSNDVAPHVASNSRYVARCVRLVSEN